MALVHGVRRLPGGGVRVRLSGREREILRSLPARLRPVLADEEDPQGVRSRLFPPAYDDPEEEAEYRELVGEGLVEERVAAVDVFARTLEGGRTGRLAWTVDLSADDAAAWLSAVNDVRLLLAAVVGVTSEDAWETGPDRRDPTSVILWYLGWLEEELVAALAGDLPDDGDPSGTLRE